MQSPLRTTRRIQNEGEKKVLSERDKKGQTEKEFRKTMSRFQSTVASRPSSMEEIRKIIFKCTSPHLQSLPNKDLRIRNDDPFCRLYFKIKCSNPQHYRVRPSEAVLDPGKTLEVCIHLLLGEHSIASDKFLVLTWLTQKDKPGKYNYQKKIIHVEIENQQQKSSQKNNQISRQQIQSQKQEYQQSILKIKDNIKEIEVGNIQGWSVKEIIIMGIISYGVGFGIITLLF